jgi:hypothetical protein
MAEGVVGRRCTDEDDDEEDAVDNDVDDDMERQVCSSCSACMRISEILLMSGFELNTPLLGPPVPLLLLLPLLPLPPPPLEPGRPGDDKV